MSRRTALRLGAALALGAGLAVLPGQARAATVVVDTTAELTSAISGAAKKGSARRNQYGSTW